MHPDGQEVRGELCTLQEPASVGTLLGARLAEKRNGGEASAQNRRTTGRPVRKVSRHLRGWRLPGVLGLFKDFDFYWVG